MLRVTFQLALLVLALALVAPAKGKECKDNNKKCAIFPGRYKESKEKYCTRWWPTQHCRRFCGHCKVEAIRDFCASQPCMNGGTCKNKEDRYECSCLAGFSGETCTTKKEAMCHDKNPMCSSHAERSIAKGKDADQAAYCKRPWPQRNCQQFCGICEVCDGKKYKAPLQELNDDIGHTACLNMSKNARFVNWNQKQKDEIVRMHNEKRAGVSPPAEDMMLLRWDNELEMLARRWAEACEKRGGLRPEPKTENRWIPGGMSVGQNIADTTDYKAAINRWWAEKKDLPKYGDEDFDYEVVYQQSGHYTQMAWSATYMIGCGAAVCTGENGEDESIIVCNYGPAGNTNSYGEPYWEGTPCEICENNCDKEYNSCSCPQTNCHGGKIDPYDCSCDCTLFGETVEFRNPHNCSLECQGNDPEQCGTWKGWKKEDCGEMFVMSECPHLCGICPSRRRPDYREPEVPGL